MGVLEIHLHEPTFSLSFGEGDTSDERSFTLGSGRTNGGGDEAERPPTTGKVVPLLVLAAVVGLTVLRNKRRRNRAD